MSVDQADTSTPESQPSTVGVSEEPTSTASEQPATAEAKPKSRAGRDLPAAIGVGGVLIALTVVSLVYWHPGIALLAIAASTVGLVELHQAFAKAGLKTGLVISLITGLGMQICAWVWGVEALLISYAVAVIFALVWHSIIPLNFTAKTSEEQTKMATSRLTDAAATITGLTYLPFLSSIVVMMAVYGVNVWLLTTYIFATVMADTGGYILGVLFGKHPVAPSISPKKSWEGLAGSVIGSLIISFIFGPWAGMVWWQCLVTGVVIAFTALIGDLAESLLKRDLGIKDMGSILPGHGGVLDRFDALLIVAPVAATLGIVFLGGW